MIDRIHQGIALTDQIDQTVVVLDKWWLAMDANPDHPLNEQRIDAWVRKLRVYEGLCDKRSEIERRLQDG